MGMTHQSQTQSTHQSPREIYEYTVYTFQRCDKKNHDKWQLQDSFTTSREALEAAHGLFESGQFCRVEVKEKYTNIAVGHISDVTIKVYERKSKMPMQKFLTLIGVEI
jgi:hypothetical protein